MRSSQAVMSLARDLWRAACLVSAALVLLALSAIGTGCTVTYPEGVIACGGDAQTDAGPVDLGCPATGPTNATCPWHFGRPHAVPSLHPSTTGLFSAALTADGVVTTVKDAGIGIEPDVQARIFNRFWQVKPTPGRGNGLGLAIAHAIVHAHGGRIWVESDPGRGSTFAFSLPYAEANN